MLIAKELTSLHRCTGWSEPLLAAFVLSAFFCITGWRGNQVFPDQIALNEKEPFFQRWCILRLNSHNSAISSSSKEANRRSQKLLPFLKIVQKHGSIQSSI